MPPSKRAHPQRSWLPATRFSPVGRACRLLLAVVIALGVAAGSAQADDLLVLNGDSETLSGNQQYGLVYIDGNLQLVGDTAIHASSIYIGPDASLNTCFVTGVGYNGCTAGRSLTLQSTGPLTVATGIDLTGGTGAVEPGGNLSLSGTSVAVSGDVTTAGSGGGASGQVSISSSGSLAVGGVYAPGATVNMSAAGPIDVADGIQSQGQNIAINGNTSQVESGGPITLRSTNGDVRIGGGLDAYGGYAPIGGGLAGGNGAPVTVTGSNVRTEAISTTGGQSGGSAPGTSAPISVTARAALDALGLLDTSGEDGASATGTPGASVTLNATGPLAIGGDVDAGGGLSAASGSITVSGSTVLGDQLGATGGNASGANPSGGPGGTIRVTAPGGATLGKLLAYGGQSDGGSAGPGGSINVTSVIGSIEAEDAETQGGYQPNGPGAQGGPIVLSAEGNLSVGDNVVADGSSAGGAAATPFSGGSAGSLTLRAAIGTLAIGGNASAEGGSGGYANPDTNIGGSGGAGGKTLVVAHAIGALASLSSAGGAGGEYGDTQGPGGVGGELLAFTNAPIFNDQEVVSSDGGDGNPTGAAGHQQQDSSPSGLVVTPATGALSFTSNSPDAPHYRVLMSVDGAAPVTALNTGATSGLRPKAPVCEPVSYTVEAIDDAVGWTSDPSAAVTYRRPPSKGQGCSDAPKVTAASPFHRSLRGLRRAHWIAELPVKTNGIGRLQLTLIRDASVPKKHGKHASRSAAKTAKTITTVTFQITSAGTHRLRLALPVAARIAGSYSLRLASTSPDGKGHLKTTLRLEIAP